jgi:hypothetical protein
LSEIPPQGRKAKMTVHKIIEDYLKANSFDGLYSPGDCACLLGDLVPCNNDPSMCEPGYKTECHGGEDCPLDGDCGFHVSKYKEAAQGIGNTANNTGKF